MRYAILLVLLLPALAWADETGWLTGTSYSGGDNWTGPDSCYASDDERAKYASTGNDSLIIHGYNANVPTGATIDTVYLRLKANGAATQGNRRRFMIGPTKNAEDLASNNERWEFAQDVDSTIIGIDGIDPLWGATWTVAEINSSNFGVHLTKSGTFNNEVRADYVSANIVYTPAGGGDIPSRRNRLLRSKPK